MSKDEKFHFPPEIDEEYKKFCYELIKRSKREKKLIMQKNQRIFGTTK